MNEMTQANKKGWDGLAATHYQKYHIEKLMARTPLVNEVIQNEVGDVLSYIDEGNPEAGYWIGKEFWGRAIATKALAEFLSTVNTPRPIFARTAKDNLASKRVLEKCGFCVIKELKSFANARGEEIDELLLVLLE